MTVRCAIYTRKSTDEGLEMEFNSLDAQREAGENYIKSQKSQGWKLIDERYDDGGFSGGNIERPALQRLMEDIKQDKIDMVVIYKIDRLTRSLMDFSKLVEVFDEHHCSFVSVTQNFNTADSMGRLTLNMLLSFAQFEREVIAERIHDKISASKKKGMWMGGRIPYGYDSVDKKLVPNEDAETVRLIFKKYLVLQSETQVKDYINSLGRQIKGKNGMIKFTNATIRGILINPIYIGKIRYKDEIYDGMHKAIVSEDLYNEVQKIKSKDIRDRYTPNPVMQHSLLKGMLRCESCNSAVIPSRTTQKSRVYEYYVCVHAVKEGRKHCPLSAIPAGLLDDFVLEKLQFVLNSPYVMAGVINKVTSQLPTVPDIRVIEKLKDGAECLKNLPTDTQRLLIHYLIKQILITPDSIKIMFTETALELMDKEQRAKLKSYGDDPIENMLVLKVCFRKHKETTKIFVPDDYNPLSNDALCMALVKAFKWNKILEDERIPIYELAKRCKMSREQMGKILRMTFLAPDIIRAIFEGTYPKKLSLTQITEREIPLLWSEQRKLYGFI